MKFHSLKCWPPYFAELRDDRKTFEVRNNDRNYQEGDVLVLQEYLPSLREIVEAPFDTSRPSASRADLEDLSDGFTGDVELARVRYVLREAPGLQAGYVVLGLGRVVLKAAEDEIGPGPN